MNLEDQRRCWHQALLCLGTNIGNRKANLKEALKRLEQAGVWVNDASPVYFTEPVDFKEQDWFLNQVLRVSTQLDPLPLLQLCLSIEQSMGRSREVAKGPRSIDIDLLLYEDTVLATPVLTIPHPQLHLRRFVLQPLAALVPDFVHPTLKETISCLLDRCPDHSKVVLCRN
jgi:2-amino-4-hydroxy-6-hydroxymethyldihydropteridine diphosphokinase